MNKFWKYVGIGGLVVGALASIVLVGKPMSKEECEKLEDEVKSMVDPNEI